MAFSFSLSYLFSLLLGKRKPGNNKGSLYELVGPRCLLLFIIEVYFSGAAVERTIVEDGKGAC